MPSNLVINNQYIDVPGSYSELQPSVALKVAKLAFENPNSLWNQLNILWLILPKSNPWVWLHLVAFPFLAAKFKNIKAIDRWLFNVYPALTLVKPFIDDLGHASLPFSHYPDFVGPNLNIESLKLREYIALQETYKGAIRGNSEQRDLFLAILFRPAVSAAEKEASSYQGDARTGYREHQTEGRIANVKRWDELYKTLPLLWFQDQQKRLVDFFPLVFRESKEEVAETNWPDLIHAIAGSALNYERVLDLTVGEAFLQIQKTIEANDKAGA